MTNEEFFHTYGTRNQFLVVADEFSVFVGYDYTIKQAVTEIGGEVVTNFVQQYINDLRYFITGSNTPTPQDQQICWLIITQYWRLQVAELVLFFVRCKAGLLGKFFSRIEPMDILSRLSDWSEYCKERERYLYYKHQEEQL